MGYIQLRIIRLSAEALSKKNALLTGIVRSHKRRQFRIKSEVQYATFNTQIFNRRAAVLEAIGVSGAQTAIVVGFTLPFDRILDMMRTVVNVTGDLAVATTIAKWENELDEDIYRKRPMS